MQKKALIGIIVIVVIFIVNILYIGNKNLWFERKNKYWTVLNSGEGLREGTLVTFKGIKVGEVSKLDFTEENRIKATFTIRKSLAEKIYQGSLVKVARTMLIGEKRMEVVPGSKENDLIHDKGYIPALDLMEISDLLSGDMAQKFLPSLESTLNSIDVITKSFAKHPDMGDKLVTMLDDANLMMKAMQRSFLFKKSIEAVKAERRRKARKRNL